MNSDFKRMLIELKELVEVRRNNNPNQNDRDWCDTIEKIILRYIPIPAYPAEFPSFVKQMSNDELSQISPKDFYEAKTAIAEGKATEEQINLYYNAAPLMPSSCITLPKIDMDLEEKFDNLINKNYIQYYWRKSVNGWV